MIKIGTYGWLEKGAINYSLWIPGNLQRWDYTLPGIPKNVEVPQVRKGFGRDSIPGIYIGDN